MEGNERTNAKIIPRCSEWKCRCGTKNGRARMVCIMCKKPRRLTEKVESSPVPEAKCSVSRDGLSNMRASSPQGGDMSRDFMVMDEPDEALSEAHKDRDRKRNETRVKVRAGEIDEAGLVKMLADGTIALGLWHKRLPRRGAAKDTTKETKAFAICILA